MRVASRIGEELNFALTNALPRRALGRLMRWFSRIRHPLVARASIAVWRMCSDLDLSDAAERRFASLHDCFTRRLAPGARPVDQDPRVLVSPSDGIVVACGGRLYPLGELLLDPALAEYYRDGVYVTLRLTPSMYHRFHAPLAARIREVRLVPGDAWNVNGPALRRVDRLYCRNERAVVCLQAASGWPLVTLVPVAAVLVASLRLHVLGDTLPAASGGSHVVALDTACEKGEELGWFEHGSTVVVLAPAGCELAGGIEPGIRMRMGRPLMRVPAEC